MTAPGNTNETLSAVEKVALESSPFEAMYPPAERIVTVVVDSFPMLGRLAALRFIEWVQQNPAGAISLPTGKTPEHFIKWVGHLVGTWDEPKTRQLLEASGIDPSVPAEMKGLHFVQIDEFYPIQPTQKNSFHYYVNEYYIKGFGLDAGKALLIDCRQIGLAAGQSLQTLWPEDEVDLSLRYRHPRGDLERRQAAALARIDQWCQEYEQKIRDLGGIGFFLGGIGPDGHIGFNMRGSDHFSTTRLMPTNYETQAAAAVDLGGIEVARKRRVITIGLGTLTYNPRCTAIVLAAGDAKAPIVAHAVQDAKDVLVPATALHVLPNARFYVTQGAAAMLAQRQYQLLTTEPELTDGQAERIVVDLAVAKGKRILDLDRPDFQSDRFASAVLERRGGDHETLRQMVHDRLVGKIERGAAVRTDTRFWHTEPHHDDLMLGCLAAIVRHVRNPRNVHYFATMTSGFTSVSNRYMRSLAKKLRAYMQTGGFSELFAQGYFDPDDEHARQRDVWQYLDGVAEANEHNRDEGTARRLMRSLIAVHDEADPSVLDDRLFELEHYLDTEYPGGKDPPHIQQLKGSVREWEAECLWGYFGWGCSHVAHLRLGFYTGDIFNPEPTMDRDVPPILEALDGVRPDVVTVALDPEASGPDTHYKTMQAISEALKRHAERTGRDDIRVWGYRNVWYRFHPAEAELFVPVSLNMFSVMESAFMNTFVSQKDASFPSFEYDGPFCDLAQKIQVEQYQKIKTCLGRDWFHEHPSALIRATRGLVFLRDLSLDDFTKLSRHLRRATDGV